MPISLEDCIALGVELKEKEFRLTFEDNDLSHQNKQLKIKNLEVCFLLSENFLDENFVPPVRILKFNKHYTRSVIRYCRLNDFVELINKRKYKIKFYATYYNGNKSLLILELIKDDILQDRFECDIELNLESIVYKWD